MVQADSEPGHSSEKSPFQFGTWYPIESAPKDGSSILLIQSIDYGFRLRHGLYFSAHWNDDDEAWESCETGVTSSRRFTNWMPLPPPPSSDDRTEEVESATASMKQSKGT